MIIRRFIMEDWLASHKDSCRFNFGESGMPDITVGEVLARCGENAAILENVILKDHDTRGTERLRCAIHATYAPSVAFEHLTVTTGTSEALFILFNLLHEHRPVVVAPRPAFQALYEVPRALGLEVRFYDLEPGNGWLPDADAICRLIDDRTGTVVINTPHNPSGIFFPRDAAERIIAKAAFHGAMVVSDEHYRFLPLRGPAPVESLARPGENVIATGSITKCFGTIGLRVGWIAAPEALISRIREFRDYLTHTLSPLSDLLASLVLEHTQAFIEPARNTLRRNVGALEDFRRTTPGISLALPEGGVVAFPQFSYAISSQEFSRRLIEKHGIFVLPGHAFEMEGCFRINLGQNPEQFRDALDILREFCAQLEGR